MSTVVSASPAPSSNLPTLAIDASPATGAVASGGKPPGGGAVDFLALLMLALPVAESTSESDGQIATAEVPGVLGDMKKNKGAVGAAMLAAALVNVPPPAISGFVDGKNQSQTLTDTKGTIEVPPTKPVAPPTIQSVAASVVSASPPAASTIPPVLNEAPAVQPEQKLPEKLPELLDRGATASKPFDLRSKAAPIGQSEQPTPIDFSADHGRAFEAQKYAPMPAPLEAKVGTSAVVLSSTRHHDVAEPEHWAVLPSQPTTNPTVSSPPLAGPAPAGPAREPEKPSDPPAVQILTHISAHLDHARRQGQVELQLDLHPPELGRVQIRMAMEDNHLHVRMVVQDEAAKRVLEPQVGTLKSRVEEMGVSVGRFDIRRDSSTPDQQRQTPSESSAEPAQTNRVAPAHGQKPFLRVSRRSGLVDVIA